MPFEPIFQAFDMCVMYEEHGEDDVSAAGASVGPLFTGYRLLLVLITDQRKL